MEWYEIAVDGERTVKFSSIVSHLGASQHQEQKQLELGDNDAASDEDCSVPQQGGIIKRGTWCWLSSGNELEIRALRTGQTIATYEFVEARGYDSCYIRCVEELFPSNNETVLLAVCLECFRTPGRGCSFIAIYSIEHSQVLSCIELPLHITAAAFISENCCRRSLLQNFDGCLAVGSEEGVILLLDLNVNKIISAYDERVKAPNIQLNNEKTTCQISDYNLPFAEIHRSFQRARNDNVHFGLQVEVIDTPCTVQCLLPIDLCLGLAIGLEDGRLAFYDLAEMQIIHIATPQPQQAIAPIVKLSYLEPLDDPRHCLYVWAMHEHDDSLSAVLHTLVYEKRLSDADGFYYFESFLTGSARLQLPLECHKSVAIGCQSINKIQNTSLHNNGFSLNTTQTEEDGYSLCALTWFSTQEEKNKLLIFDLNQWYKEAMPYSTMNQKCPSYLAGYVLSGRQCALSAYLNPSTVAHFNSLQRCEEHFYPNSLSFDCLLLLPDSSLGYTWIGAQNKIINVLRASNSSIFLEPDMYFREILRTRLLPQFSELNVDSTFSRLAIFETILSVALEHNCFSLLRDCAKCWADGSFMGCNFTATTGISLSTLTDWIWKRASDIKARCNDLSKGLFDYAGYPLDQREQKELGFLTRQLKLLGDLLGEVLVTGKRYIPDNVYRNLETQHQSLKMAAEYHDILLWLLNIGLLPEMQENRNNFSLYKPYGKSKIVFKSNQPNTNTIQYPYDDLKNIYARRREFFARSNENFISKKTGSCRLLFIDALIAHECKGDGLRECWLENGGTGLYPPPSIEAMLRVMLVPEMKFESKCAVLLYFFLDLHMTIDEQAHKEIVDSFVKFPSVFKLSATLIKTVQSLWNLDHGLFQPAVDEFISPFNNNQTYSQWMLELLIESLLTQNASHFALRILEARPTLISPVLKLKTLLANELVSEAFHFARTKQDDTLLELFFKCCLCAGKYGVIRDLALNEREGQLVQRILRSSKTLGAENLHFVYLLQKSKYIEAVSYMDELSRTKTLRGQYGNESSIAGSTDTPNLVLSAFNTTMAPVTQSLTDVYFRIKNKIKKKETDNRSPVPLSCQLIKQNANNLLGGIYHSSALSAHFATYYWGEIDNERRERNGAPINSLLSANNAPFLRKPQVDACHLQLEHSAHTGISYPQPYRATEKRTLVERELEQADVPDDVSNIMLNTNAQPRKRRRLLGQEIVDDLGHFMQMNKSAQQLTARGFDLKGACEAQTHVSEPTATATTEYVTQPLNTPRRRLATCDESRGDLSAVPGLHSILKTSNTPERSVRAQSARRELHTALEESKNLRFKLPVTDVLEKEETAAEKPDIENKLQQKEEVCSISRINNERNEVVRTRRVVTTTTVDDDVEESVSTKETPVKIADVPKESTQEDVEMVEDDAVDELLIEVRHESSPSVVPSPHKHKSEARAVSVDSNASKSSKHSGEDDDDEDEDFYSPLSSRNNSLLMNSARSPLSTQPSISISSVYETATSKLFQLSGPQPRKPLARLSAERSQSRTPEKQAPPEAQIEASKKKESEDEVQNTQQNYIENQPSSGYSSVSSTRISNTVNIFLTDKPSFQIKSVLSLASSDFVPHSSSSKIAATQSKFNFEEPKPRAPPGKLSECSTMVGSFSVEESAFATEADKVDEVINDTTAHSQLQTSPEFAQPKAAHHLQTDTTLGMSSYDFTIPDAKSQHILQSTNIEVGSAKHKEAILKVMETVEVMDTDEQADDTQYETCSINPNEEQQQQSEHTQAEDVASAAVKTKNDLLGLPLQQPTADVNIDDSEDSNDVVALYENKREAVEKHRQKHAANESDSDVIILSSTASSPNMFGDQGLDSDSESDDEDENAYGDDGEEEDENEGEDRICSKDETASSSSSIEIIDASNSSTENNVEEEQEEDNRLTAEEPNTETEPEVVAPVEIEDKNEHLEIKSSGGAETVTLTKDNETKIQFDQDTRNESSMHSNYGSVESETRIVIEDVASSCADYEELVMRETVIFDESDDEELTSSTNAQEMSSYFSKSIIAQKDGEIIIEELKVSAYSATSKEVYEDLGDDVFYCDAETTNESVEAHESRETERTSEEPSTSAVIGKRISEVAAKSVNETETGIEPKVEVNVPACSENAETNVQIKGVEGGPQVVIEVKEGAKKDLEEQEEQIKLHVDEDLSEAELMEVEMDAVNDTAEPTVSVAIEKEKVVATAIIGHEVTTLQSEDESQQKSTQAMESPTAIQPEETQESKVKHIERRTSQGESPEPTDKTLNSVQTSVNMEGTSEKLSPVSSSLEENEINKLSSTPTRNRYNRRGTSVPPPPVEIAVNIPIDEVSTPKRHTRGISMPPQSTAQQEQEGSVHTPNISENRRRSTRARSVQPSEESSAQPGTPRTRRSVRGVSVPHDVDEAAKSSTPVRTGRGTSVPPPATIVTRRRSALLEAINESTPIVDSPSARTRSRIRLNSVESELDSSIVSGGEQAPRTKRTRRSSVSSSVSEQPTTPSNRRTRRSNIATTAPTAVVEAATEVGTPKSLRRTTRRVSLNTENLDTTQPLEEHEQETEETSKLNKTTTESALYSSARRLTRTQLAMMEKSAALLKNTAIEGLRSGDSISPPTNKRVNKRRSSRSTVPDSDDVESISSHVSNVSGAPKRRVTRSSVKDKEDNDDDLASIASSVGSERTHKRRSKESKNSPNTTLSTIQEDEAEGEAGQKKRSRQSKKNVTKSQGEPSP